MSISENTHLRAVNSRVNSNGMWSDEEIESMNSEYRNPHWDCEFCRAEICVRDLCQHGEGCDVPEATIPPCERQYGSTAARVCPGCVAAWERGDEPPPPKQTPPSIFAQMARADLRQAAIEECWRLRGEADRRERL